ncbi:P-loop NTPase fold protein [Ardenticatena maritima]|nr:P-loop NTPase fold protein [Ardenticatena maritima]
MDAQSLQAELERIARIENEYERLGGLLQVLSSVEQFEDAHRALSTALDISQRFRYPVHRALALAALAPYLPEGLLAEALHAARGIKNEGVRAEVLAVIAQAFAQAGDTDHALATARSIEVERYRAHALALLAPHLPKKERAHVLAEALATARSIEDERYRARALGALAPHLPQDLLIEIIDVARSIEDERYRTIALLGLVRYLPAELLPEALDAARSIEDERYRTIALLGLADHLPAELLPEALDVARSIEDEWDRAHALAALAPHLPRDLLAEALNAARSIEDERYRAHALADIARAMVQVGDTEQAIQILQEALDKISDEEIRDILRRALDEIHADAGGSRSETRIEKELTIEAAAFGDHPTTDDALGYRIYARVLADFIKSEQTQKPLTIAILAPWGMGKTSLMRMIQKELQKELQPEEEASPSRLRRIWQKLNAPWRCLRAFYTGRPPNTTFPLVWFNAWKYEKAEALWAALVVDLLAQVKAQGGWCWWAGVALRLRMKRMRWGRFGQDIAKAFVLGGLVFGAVKFVAWWQGDVLPILKTMPEVAAFIAFLAPLLNSIWMYLRHTGPFNINAYLHNPDYEARIGFLRTFEDDFRYVVESITQGGRWPLVVFIDDLDRCPPPKPVEIIEAINHLIDAQHCVFVLAMDEEMVLRSIAVKYKELDDGQYTVGGRTLAHRFMEKIIQLPVRLPPLHQLTMEKFVEKLLGPIQETARPTLQQRTTPQLQPVAPAQQPTDDAPPKDPSETNTPTSERIQQAAERLQAERRARPEKAVEEIAQELFPNEPEEIRRRAVEYVEERWHESADIRHAIHRALEHLEPNPRQAKRFVNIFRLQTMLAKEVGCLSRVPTDAELDALAAAIVIQMRWPHLARQALTNPEAFGKLHEAVQNGNEQQTDVPETLRSYLQDKDAHTFLKSISDRDYFRDMLAFADFSLDTSSLPPPEEEAQSVV